jgi:outer membrane protein assembly factor BamD (BamD/ComL family)
MATTTTAPTKAAPTAPTPVAPATAAAMPAWLQNPRVLGGVLGGIALVAAAVWFVRSSATRKEDFANRALQGARQAAESGNLPLAASELQKVSQTYKGTRAGTEAVLSLNQVRLLNNQAELAVVGLREFAATNPKGYVAQTQALLGVSLENTKKPAEAAAAYLAAASAAEVDFLKAQYLLDAGRAWVAAGKPEEAAKAYRDIIAKFEKTPAVTEAKVRLAELTKGQL